jgi:hypothetical protein
MAQSASGAAVLEENESGALWLRLSASSDAGCLYSKEQAPTISRACFRALNAMGYFSVSCGTAFRVELSGLIDSATKYLLALGIIVDDVVNLLIG